MICYPLNCDKTCYDDKTCHNRCMLVWCAQNLHQNESHVINQSVLKVHLFGGYSNMLCKATVIHLESHMTRA